MLAASRRLSFLTIFNYVPGCSTIIHLDADSPGSDLIRTVVTVTQGIKLLTFVNETCIPPSLIRALRTLSSLWPGAGHNHTSGGTGVGEPCSAHWFPREGENNIEW